MSVSLQALGMAPDGRMVRCFKDVAVPPDGLTLLGVARAGGPDVVALVEAGATLLVNGELAAPDATARNGDEVSIVVAVGGG